MSNRKETAADRLERLEASMTKTMAGFLIGLRSKGKTASKDSEMNNEKTEAVADVLAEVAERDELCPDCNAPAAGEVEALAMVPGVKFSGELNNPAASTWTFNLASLHELARRLSRPVVDDAMALNLLCAFAARGLLAVGVTDSAHYVQQVVFAGVTGTKAQARLNSMINCLISRATC